MSPLYAPAVRSRRPWWQTAKRRSPSAEIMYLILQGPLVIEPEERLFVFELWRKAGRPRRWPTQYQLACFFGVSERQIRRWVDSVQAARMATFHRPYNIPNGSGGWRGPHKPAGWYELHPPSAWLYRNGWIYLDHRRGWVTPEGEIVPFPPDVFSFPETPEDGSAGGDSVAGPCVEVRRGNGGGNWLAPASADPPKVQKG